MERNNGIPRIICLTKQYHAFSGAVAEYELGWGLQCCWSWNRTDTTCLNFTHALRFPPTQVSRREHIFLIFLPRGISPPPASASREKKSFQHAFPRSAQHNQLQPEHRRHRRNLTSDTSYFSVKFVPRFVVYCMSLSLKCQMACDAPALTIVVTLPCDAKKWAACEYGHVVATEPKRKCSCTYIEQPKTCARARAAPSHSTSKPISVMPNISHTPGKATTFRFNANTMRSLSMIGSSSSGARSHKHPARCRQVA